MNKSNRGGFTVIELGIVALIIALLAAILGMFWVCYLVAGKLLAGSSTVAILLVALGLYWAGTATVGLVMQRTGVSARISEFFKELRQEARADGETRP